MPVPVSYSEAQLAAFMLAVIGSAADVLGWNEGTLAGEPVEDALILAGVSVITAATNVGALRAAAKIAAWRAVAGATAGLHDFSADGQSMSLSQVHKMALE